MSVVHLIYIAYDQHREKLVLECTDPSCFWTWTLPENPTSSDIVQGELEHDLIKGMSEVTRFAQTTVRDIFESILNPNPLYHLLGTLQPVAAAADHQEKGLLIEILNTAIERRFIPYDVPATSGLADILRQAMRVTDSYTEEQRNVALFMCTTLIKQEGE